MSIIIKGMDMPQNCGECKFESAQYVNNYCRRVFCSLGADYEHCPLIEIDDELYEKAVNAYVLQQVRYRNVDNH